MSKISNSVYGLALGDALGYRTEFHSFAEIVKDYGDEDIYKIAGRILISDDTQMSLYLIKALSESYNRNHLIVNQEDKIATSIAQNFVLWLNDGNNGRAPGNACLASCNSLEKYLEMPKQWLKTRAGIPLHAAELIHASGDNNNSKGSGTVMRSPWIGLLHAQGAIPDDYLRDFTRIQASLTHQHPTAIAASYLCAWLTSKLYTGDIHPGEVGAEAYLFAQQQEDNLGWRELMSSLSLLNNIPESYRETSHTDFDISSITGYKGTAEDVLSTSIALIDNFGNDPVSVIQRAMFTTGDSDTIGAVAGGMIGAYYDDDIWEGLKDLVELEYVPQLDNAICYIESLTS